MNTGFTTSTFLREGQRISSIQRVRRIIKVNPTKRTEKDST
jgi:hypothetical protein